MHIALLFAPFSLPEIRQLTHEFPQFIFLSYNDSNRRTITEDQWSKVEILFTSRLSVDELLKASNLRWIHCPVESTRRLCLPEIEKRGNILVTYTREHNSIQTAEFVLGATLAFTKNLYEWKQANRFPSIIWDAKWRQTMQTLEGKNFLQVGMGPAGVETARKAQEQGMRVVSIESERSFHPYCLKNLSINDLPSELVHADVISINFTNHPERKNWFGTKDLQLLKKEAILIILGQTALLDSLSEENLQLFEKLRGCLIDVPYEVAIPSTSKIWQIPNLIITPDVASRPKTKDPIAYRLFKNNLRQYVRDNFIDMRYIIDTSLVLAEEETFF